MQKITINFIDGSVMNFEATGWDVSYNFLIVYTDPIKHVFPLEKIINFKQD